jgi:hypothetical protein
VVQDNDEDALPSSPEISSVSRTCASITTHHTAQTSLPEEKSHSTQPVVKKLIEHGNVTLIFPAAADKQVVHIVVSADILCAASKVFAKMLSGGWKEAVALEETNSVDITLPEDDPEAMQQLLSVFHFRTKDLPSPPTLDVIARMRALCEKYDLAHTAIPWIKDYLRQHSIPKLDAVETSLYMLAAEGCCKDLSQAIRHHALATLMPDFWKQWQTHELLRDLGADVITGNYTLSYGNASTQY